MQLFGTAGQAKLFCPGTKGQRDRSSFIVPGQRDNGTSSKSCHGTGRAGIFWDCPVPSRDVPRDRSKKKLLKKGDFFWFFSWLGIWNSNNNYLQWVPKWVPKVPSLGNPNLYWFRIQSLQIWNILSWFGTPYSDFEHLSWFRTPFLGNRLASKLIQGIFNFILNLHFFKSMLKC